MPDDLLPPRERVPSAHEIAKEVAAELSGGYPIVSDTPPALRLIQKWWWKISIAASIEFAGHVLHEVIARGWHR